MSYLDMEVGRAEVRRRRMVRKVRWFGLAALCGLVAGVLSALGGALLVRDPVWSVPTLFAAALALWGAIEAFVAGEDVR